MVHYLAPGDVISFLSIAELSFFTNCTCIQTSAYMKQHKRMSISYIMDTFKALIDFTYSKTSKNRCENNSSTDAALND